MFNGEELKLRTWFKLCHWPGEWSKGSLKNEAKHPSFQICLVEGITVCAWKCSHLEDYGNVYLHHYCLCKCVQCNFLLVWEKDGPITYIITRRHLLQTHLRKIAFKVSIQLIYFHLQEMTVLGYNCFWKAAMSYNLRRDGFQPVLPVELCNMGMWPTSLSPRYSTYIG
jgi:hypothetical protein